MRMRQIHLNIGDTVYYVVGEDSVYSIKKTRIVETQIRSSGLRLGNNPIFEYIVYQTEDGKILNESSFRNKEDELPASQVFHTKADAVNYIIHCLHCEINIQWQTLLNAQKRMLQAERVLHMYEKYGK